MRGSTDVDNAPAPHVNQKHNDDDDDVDDSLVGYNIRLFHYLAASRNRPPNKRAHLKIIFPISQPNIRCEYSKEPSQ